MMNLKAYFQDKLPTKVILIWMVTIYLWMTAILGAWFFTDNILHLMFKSAEPRIEFVPLGNGFIYTKYGRITDDKGNTVINSDVERIGTRGNVIYGYVDDDRPGVFYFICTYREDCSGSKNYSKAEFEALRKKKGLPPLYYFHYDDRVTLVMKEWVKRKLALQEAPPSPFLGGSPVWKEMKGYLLYLGTFLVLCPFASYPCLIFSLGALGLLLICALGLHRKNHSAPLNVGLSGEEAEVRKPRPIVWKYFFLWPIKGCFFLMSVMGAIVLLLVYFSK
jgi:hypothetical protein